MEMICLMIHDQGEVTKRSMTKQYSLGFANRQSQRGDSLNHKNMREDNIDNAKRFIKLNKQNIF